MRSRLFVRGGDALRPKNGTRPVSRSVRGRALFEPLEDRRLMCSTELISALGFGYVGHADLGSGAPGPTVSVQSQTATAISPMAEVAADPVSPAGLPLLNSVPGAPTAVYLDFDGYVTSTQNTLPYDTDGSPATFNTTEQAAIKEAWRHVASYLAMFNTNVTTVRPAVPYSYSLITNSVTGPGYSYGGFPTTDPRSYNGSGDARNRQSGIAHEVGHNFGLGHQSDYDLWGEKMREYSSGYDRLHGPIMGVDYAQDIHKWFIGHPTNSASLLQDDVAVIAGKIRPFSGGDGMRPDDHPNATSAARALVSQNGTYSASGIIERIGDLDVFSFTSHGGQLFVDVVPPNPSMLDAAVELYSSDGRLVAAADGSNNDQHLAIPSLPAGTYYVVVKSHGDYGDLGLYDLTVRSLPSGFATADVGSVGQAGFAGGSTNEFHVTGGGAGIAGTTDEFRFAYTQLTGDGSITARVDAQEATAGNAKAGVMLREGLGANARHVTLSLTPGQGALFNTRTTAGGTTTQATAGTAAAPYWVRLVRSGSTITGFTSPDGVAWTPAGGATVGFAPVLYAGLAVTSSNDATTGDVRFSGVALTGNAGMIQQPINSLSAPANVVVGHGAGTGLTVSWSAVAGATGYVVERSTDGAVWSSAGNPAAGVTALSDPALNGGRRYFYRVFATDVSGRSAPSAVVNQTTRPAAVTSLTFTSWRSDAIVLNWRDVSGETGYRVERLTDATNNTWSAVATVAANVPSYTVTGLSPAASYRFRVVPTSPFGDSAAVETSGVARLPAVTGLQFTAKESNRMAIRWNAVPGAATYRVERSPNGIDWNRVATQAGTTYEDTNVQPLTEYFYRIFGIAGAAESMRIAPVFAASPPSAAQALPAPWASRDVGSVGGTGAAGFSGGTFTVVSGGNDIWDRADAFHFTYQPLSGDGEIVARVAVQEHTSGWAKSGVMIRETLASNSRHAMMVTAPENGTAFQSRVDTAGLTTNVNTGGTAAPYWVRLVRTGSTIVGYRSSNGATWVEQGRATISMGTNVYVGLAVVPGDNADLNTTTFTNVTVSNRAPTVATPAAASPVPVTGLTTALSVLGADDHGEANLRYAWAAEQVPPGAAAPAFSASGTNAARNVTATFSRVGTYVLRVTITDSAGLTATSAVSVQVVPTATGLRITPAAPRVGTGQSVQLGATVLDQFGEAMTPAPAPAMEWVTGDGSIDATGRYTAPTVPGRYLVGVTAGALSAEVEVEVVKSDVTAPTLVSAASRKRHGAKGVGDLPLLLGGASPTVEPRKGGATTLRLVFSEALVAADGVLDAGEFTVTNATFTSAAVESAGGVFVVTLELGGVADRSLVTVALKGLADAAGNALAGDADVAVRSIFGDVDGSGAVTNLDVLAVRGGEYRPGAWNYLLDVDLSGAVNAVDLMHVRYAAARPAYVPAGR